ncbi:4-hydroxy-tetrahydrodipicolinate reductase [Pseudoalteromonas sp. CIP111854]|uniref:4-hydroxy-tetrahydrodipicolinate reductase n=1 Tax=Pseudoalteromonas holothuriae TaxID=2963714 RepID=A0A9W4QSU7_9GAMM|nr:4-hydroxy-tetrahydrodipicolinate reductase [Pseudoalteromonas sp. CIP111854]CAH9051246.1 4-hydroxy-tetrahydrodipicolinate reductase [Pseudoalteromonas sp. CIP111854]
MTKIAIFGANGRMGKVLCEACLISNDSELVAALVRQEHALIGSEVTHLISQGKTALTYTGESDLVNDVDVAIDFTLPLGMKKHLSLAIERKLPIVIGTTGLTAQDMAELKAAAKHIPIVFSRNFSVGINILENLVKVAAQTLNEDVDIEVFEAHHRHKVDAPSGTALMIGEAIAEAKGWEHEQVARYDRTTEEQAKAQNEIGYSVLRAGDIVGEHTAYFATMGERLELTHKATSRLTFATGAVRAAKWLRNKPNGLYDMQDVLGLK